MGNVALRRPATQSSTTYSGPASLAVDGNSDGRYFQHSCTHTASEAGPWWRVDLQETQPVRAVKVYNRADCCGNRLSGFEVRVGNTDAWGASYGLHTCGGEHSVGQGDALAVPCGGQQARYVFVGIPARSSSARNILTLCEVEVVVQHSSGSLSVSPGVCGGAQRGGCDRSSGQCLCREGYTGSSCEGITCPSTSLGMCSGRGACNTAVGSCQCSAGFYGLACLQRLEELRAALQAPATVCAAAGVRLTAVVERNPLGEAVSYDFSVTAYYPASNSSSSNRSIAGVLWRSSSGSASTSSTMVLQPAQLQPLLDSEPRAVLNVSVLVADVLGRSVAVQAEVQLERSSIGLEVLGSSALTVRPDLPTHLEARASAVACLSSSVSFLWEELSSRVPPSSSRRLAIPAGTLLPSTTYNFRVTASHWTLVHTGSTNTSEVVHESTQVQLSTLAGPTHASIVQGNASEAPSYMALAAGDTMQLHASVQRYGGAAYGWRWSVATLPSSASQPALLQLNGTSQPPQPLEISPAALGVPATTSLEVALCVVPLEVDPSAPGFALANCSGSDVVTVAVVSRAQLPLAFELSPPSAGGVLASSALLVAARLQGAAAQARGLEYHWRERSGALQLASTQRVGRVLTLPPYSLQPLASYTLECSVLNSSSTIPLANAAIDVQVPLALHGVHALRCLRLCLVQVLPLPTGGALVASPSCTASSPCVALTTEVPSRPLSCGALSAVPCRWRWRRRAGLRWG